jgi:CRISPR-associated protein Cmr1
VKKLEYTVRFTTPAFLGNAEQQGQWRTPPFKALLRQWWRVLQQARTTGDHERIRNIEGVLFGNAWLQDYQGRPLHRRSDVRVRILPSWDMGSLRTDQWPGDFGRVTTTADGKSSVPADVYLGYGPVLPPSKKEGRKRIEIRGALGTEQHTRLVVTLPDGHEEEMRQTLALANWFGAVGSRSRNAWGSLLLVPEPGTAALPELEDGHELFKRIGRPWLDCLDLDWPHALGTDAEGQPLIWVTEHLPDWRKAIGRLANIRVAVRQAAKRIHGTGGNAGAIHYLGYPAGTGNKNPWALRVKGHAQEPRLAGQLRFKIMRASGGEGVHGMVFHLPCGIPGEFLDQLADDRARTWLGSRENEIKAWSAVHDALMTDRRLKQMGS